LSDYSRLDKELLRGWRRVCDEEEEEKKEEEEEEEEGTGEIVGGIGLARDTTVCREWRSQSMLEGRIG